VTLAYGVSVTWTHGGVGELSAMLASHTQAEPEAELAPLSRGGTPGVAPASFLRSPTSSWRLRVTGRLEGDSASGPGRESATDRAGSLPVPPSHRPCGGAILAEGSRAGTTATALRSGSLCQCPAAAALQARKLEIGDLKLAAATPRHSARSASAPQRPQASQIRRTPPGQNAPHAARRAAA
jgi:hypothetical protein